MADSNRGSREQFRADSAALREGYEAEIDANWNDLIGINLRYHEASIALHQAAFAATPIAATSIPTQDVTLLTGAFYSDPDSHKGDEFQLIAQFSAFLSTEAAAMCDHGFVVTGGQITSAWSDGGNCDRWVLTVLPDGADPVTLKSTDHLFDGARAVEGFAITIPYLAS